MFIKSIFYNYNPSKPNKYVDKYSIQLEAELQSLSSKYGFTPKNSHRLL